MKRILALLVIAAYMVVAIAPLLSNALGLPAQKIHGTLPPSKRPPVTVHGVLHEGFQRGFTAWFENHRGLRGYAVYVDNHVLYHGLGETRVGSRVRLGRGKQLFIDEDIDFLDRREHGIPQPAVLADLMDRVARVQQRLRARGQALVPIIIPSKTSIFRDQVEPRWIRDFGAAGFPSDHQLYQPLIAGLTARGVTFVDMRAALATSAHPRDALWGAEARHWSQFAACLANQQIVASFATLLARSPLPYRCALERPKVPRNHDDYDLWRLLNTWNVKRVALTAPIAVHAAPLGVTTPPPSVVYVGTSFNWALIRDAVASQLVAPIHMHYYDSQLISWPDGQSVPMKAGDAAWRERLSTTELIVLDLHETSLYSGHVYLENFLAAAEAFANQP